MERLSMLSLGQRFREQREKQKISLDAISERTKINPKYLRAIETENFDDLPAGLFRRSFVRQYADALRLDTPEIESEIDEIFGPAERSQEFLPEVELDPEPETVVDIEAIREPGMNGSGEHRLAWSIGLFIFALAACSGIYALWQHTQESDPVQRAALSHQITDAPRTSLPVNEPVSEPAAEAPPPPREAAEAPPPPREEEQVPAPISSVPTQVTESKPEPLKPEPELPEAARLKSIPSAPDPVVAQPVLLPPPPPAEPKAVEANANPPKKSNIVVEISATERVWVRTTADRQPVFRGMLGAQERKSFEGTQRTRILVGDAGAVNVIWNGKSIGPIGRSGQMRIIEFTPDTYQILSP